MKGYSLSIKIILPLFLYLPFLFSVDFVLFTQPKTGTHLLLDVLADLTGKEPYTAREYMRQNSQVSHNCRQGLVLESPYCTSREFLDTLWDKNEKQGTFIHFHTRYTKEMEEYIQTKGAIVFFIKRDPRDQIVSLMNHYKIFNLLSEKEKQQSDSERLSILIRKRLKKGVYAFREWLTSPVCCVLDFSKLMGSHGGVATDVDALNEMKKIAEALQLPFLDRELEEIYQRHLGRGGTFFRGKVGSWREFFSEEDKKRVKQDIGKELIQLGFESDLAW